MNSLLPCNICGQLPRSEPGVYRNFGTFSQWFYYLDHLCSDGGFHWADSETEEDLFNKWNEVNPIVIKKGTQLSLF